MSSDLVGAVLATVFILVAYGFLRAQAKVIDLTIDLEKARAYVAEQNRKEIFRHKLVIERLELSKSILPNPNLAIFNIVSDLYDQAEMLPYVMPMEAIDRDTINWRKNIQNFTDEELFHLWLARVID